MIIVRKRASGMKARLLHVQQRDGGVLVHGFGDLEGAIEVSPGVSSVRHAHAPHASVQFYFTGGYCYNHD